MRVTDLTERACCLTGGNWGLLAGRQPGLGRAAPPLGAPVAGRRPRPPHLGPPASRARRTAAWGLSCHGTHRGQSVGAVWRYQRKPSGTLPGFQSLASPLNVCPSGPCQPGHRDRLGHGERGRCPDPHPRGLWGHRGPGLADGRGPRATLLTYGLLPSHGVSGQAQEWALWAPGNRGRHYGDPLAFVHRLQRKAGLRAPWREGPGRCPAAPVPHGLLGGGRRPRDAAAGAGSGPVGSTLPPVPGEPGTRPPVL